MNLLILLAISIMCGCVFGIFVLCCIWYYITNAKNAANIDERLDDIEARLGVLEDARR